jgi:hypothetical protein
MLSSILRYLVCFGSLVVAAAGVAAEDRYFAFPSAGVEVLQPDGFERRSDGETIALVHLDSASSIVVEAFAGLIDQEIAALSTEQLKKEHPGMELLSKQEMPIAGQRGVLAKTKLVLEGEEWRQWWTFFGTPGSRKIVMVIAQCPVDQEPQMSELLKRVALSVRPIQRKGPASQPDAVSAEARAERMRGEVRGPQRTVRFGRDAEPDGNQAPAGKPAATTLKAPEQKLPVYRYRAEDVQTTDSIGNEDDRAETFDDLAPDGGVLVGVQVITGDKFGGSVAGLEPIFQVDVEYKRLGLRGASQGDAHFLVAPKGYAVGGVQVRAGLLMDAIRLVYMPVKGKQLDTEKVEYSEWVGGDGGGEEEIIGDGSLVVGFGGSFSEDEIREVRLHFVESGKVRIAAPRRASTAKKEANDHRTWKSASGKFSVEARIESFDGKQAVLVSEAGKKINVAAEKLSEADRDYLASWLEQQAMADDQPAGEEDSPFE